MDGMRPIARMLVRGAALGWMGSVAGGCAHVRPSQSGFLSDYSGLIRTDARFHEQGGLERSLVAPSGFGGLDGIDSFYIEPVAWMVDDRKWVGRSAWFRDRVVSAFEEELRDQLGTLRPIVSEPGPRTATVRSAVTNAVRTRPLFNAGMAAYLIQPMFNGGGAFEVEAIAPDGSQVAAVSTSSTGGPFELASYFVLSVQAADSARRAAADLRAALAIAGP